MNEKKTYSENIAKAIDKFLTEYGWTFSYDEKSNLFRFGVSVNGKIKNITMIIEVRDNAFIAYGISPVGCDQDDIMLKMSEFITRANYGLINGNFELDWRDGEIRFKTFVNCAGIQSPSEEMITNAIECTVWAFAYYGEGLVDTIFENKTVKEAIEECKDVHDGECGVPMYRGTDEGEDLAALIEEHLISLGFELDDATPESEEEEADDE